MKREFYPLDKAGEIVGLTVDELVHLGSQKKLSIYIPTGGFRLICSCIMSNRKKHEDWTEEVSGFGGLYRLSWRCLFSLESQSDPDVMLARKAIYSYKYDDFEFPSSLNYDEELERYRTEIGYRHYTIYRDNELSPSSIIGLMKAGVYCDFKPVKLSECKMVILHSDLEELKQKIGKSLLETQLSYGTNQSQKLIDKKAVQEIGRKLLEKYKDRPKINCTHAKKLPELKQFYERYPGNDPVIVDTWLREIGVDPGRRGRLGKAEESFIPSLD